jgi:peptide/nickel transport system substrate-binding protein
MEFNAWVDKLYLQWDFDLGYSQLTDPPDPDFAAKSLFTCANIVKVPFVNAEGYCNPTVDDLFAQAATEANRPKRAELYAEIQRIIVEDQPHVFLVDGIGPWAYSDEFQGIEKAGSKSPYYFGHTAWWTGGSSEPSG